MFKEMFINESSDWELVEDRNGDYYFTRGSKGKVELDGDSKNWYASINYKVDDKALKGYETKPMENGVKVKGSSIKELNKLLKSVKAPAVDEETFKKIKGLNTAYPW